MSDKKQTLLEGFDQESALDSYLTSGFEQVEGWCSIRVFDFLRYISSVHKQRQITGGACEIGVHHGKFFIGLHNLTGDNELSLAIDVFEDQHLNIDGSGKGDLEKFKNNLSLFTHRQESIQIMKKDSLTLSLKDFFDIEEKFGKFRFFSIDGGHTKQHTINDFKIAEQLVCGGGLVIVDDYLNQDWLGVCEGIAHLFLLDAPRLSPFMIGYGKLLFTTFSFHKEYFQLAANFVQSRTANGESFKLIQMYGHNVISWK
jgi:hypothetical protein